MQVLGRPHLAVGPSAEPPHGMPRPLAWPDLRQLRDHQLPQRPLGARPRHQGASLHQLVGGWWGWAVLVCCLDLLKEVRQAATWLLAPHQGAPLHQLGWVTASGARESSSAGGNADSRPRHSTRTPPEPEPASAHCQLRPPAEARLPAPPGAADPAGEAAGGGGRQASLWRPALPRSCFSLALLLLGAAQRKLRWPAAKPQVLQ